MLDYPLLKTFIVKAQYSATAKLFKIVAKDAEQALAKAKRNKHAKGCHSLTIAGSRGVIPTVLKRAKFRQTLETYGASK